ncbi:hypothetical protein V7S76_12880 [Aquirufa sp. ROCK2-A2]
MPKFSIQTDIKANMNHVWKQFDRNLLAKLSPPFPIVKIETFDGCQINDHVALRMDFGIWQTTWSSIIIDNKETENLNYFTDKGMKMPFGLTFWEHTHGVKMLSASTSAVVDSIEYKSKFVLLDYLLFPLFYGMILYRIPIYKKLLSTSYEIKLNE